VASNEGMKGLLMAEMSIYVAEFKVTKKFPSGRMLNYASIHCCLDELNSSPSQAKRNVPQLKYAIYYLSYQQDQLANL
jgi:hypothetical protein